MDFGTDRRLKVAIVSTYDELCGIAGYTRMLVPQLTSFADVEVFDLDQYLLRSSHKRVQELADRHVRDIAAQLEQYDAVSIQLEYGTLGRTPAQIGRRFKRLAEAARSLSVTFHTILDPSPTPWGTIAGRMARLDFKGAGGLLAEDWRNKQLAERQFVTLRQLQKRRNVRLIAHNRRDMRMLRDVYRLQTVLHHPLAYVPADRAAEIRQAAKRSDFALLAGLPADAKLVGTFGFLSPYKGFETAIRALRLLPDDHHLLVFGGVNPNGIKKFSTIDPYVKTLVDETRIGATFLDGLAEARVAASSITAGAAAEQLFAEHPGSLRGRVHFMGVLPDREFLSAMSLCDAVVLPYLEVGQTSSGPASMALDMGCRVICSRTGTFLQLARYHPGVLEFFDIGNHVELAERLASAPPPRPRLLTMNTTTNAAVYRAALDPTRGPVPPILGYETRQRVAPAPEPVA